MTWALLAINVVVFLAATAAGASDDVGALLSFGALSGPHIANGESWRLLTAMFLHVDLGHLFFNSIGLFIFGLIVEQAYGRARFAIVYLLAGLAGSVASLIFHPVGLAFGASGAIFGIVGALAAFFVVQRRILGTFGRQNLVALVVLIAIQLFYGLSNPVVDNWAHLGGLIGGFAVGLGIAPRYTVLRSDLGTPIGLQNTSSLLGRWWVPLMAAAVLLLAFQVGIGRARGQPLTPLIVAERHYDNGELDRALAEIDKAIELDPRFGRSYYLRARVLLQLGDPAGARSELSSAIRFGDRETRADAITLLVVLNRGRSG